MESRSLLSAAALSGETDRPEPDWMVLKAAEPLAVVGDPMGTGSGAAGDDHGNDSATATPVSVPSTTAGSVEMLADVDYFAFVATSGARYAFQTTLSTLTDSTLALYDVDGATQLDFNDDFGSLASYLAWTAPSSGTYYLKVASFGNSYTGSYSLLVSEDDHGATTASATPLGAPPASLPGAIEVPLDVDRFALAATAGLRYELSTTLGTLTDSTLALYDVDGVTELAFNDDFFGTASFIGWVAPASGTYFVDAASFAGLSVGGYTLSTSIDDHGDDRLTATPTTLPSTIAGELEAAGDGDWFALDAAAGAHYSFQTVLGTLADSTLTVFGTDGTAQLAFNDDAGGPAASLTWTAPTAGQYYVRVGAHADALGGSYQLAIDADDHGDDAATATPVAAWSVTSGELEIGGDADWFRFPALAAHQYELRTVLGTLADSTLTLFAGDGLTQLAFNDDFEGPGSRIGWTAPASEDVFARVEGTGVGTFSLALTPLGEVQGVKWRDDDGDQTRDAGEPGLADWTIYLDQNNNHQLDSGEPSTLTAADNPATPEVDEAGSYAFAGLVPGTYIVAEVQQDFWEQTFPPVDATLPDLRGAAFAIDPGPRQAGTPLTLSYTLVNSGSNVAAAFDLGFYLSDDATIGAAGDLLLGSVVDPVVLAPGQSFSGSITVGLPAAGNAFWTGDHVYTLGLLVDPAGEVAEASEANNANQGSGQDLRSTTIFGTVPSSSQFNVEVNFIDSTLTPGQRAVFSQAALRWSQVITGDIPAVNVPGHGLVDDVVIDASAPPIDGVGGILGQAGPTLVRNGSFLPGAGVMQFDSADLANLESTGQLFNVILHEMGHVLGLGTIWNSLGLLVGAGSSDPRFTGAQATAEFNSIFAQSAADVPVENTGGAGTRDSHWREATFNNELMTGFLNGGANPLSRVTAAQFADLGYVVDLSAADAYAPPSAAPGGAAASQLGQELLVTRPAFEVLAAEGATEPVGSGAGAAGPFVALGTQVVIVNGQIELGRDFGNRPLPVDLGDAPDPSFPTRLTSGGARHLIVPGLHLGLAVDAEIDGQPTVPADGDDLAGDDEDGVAWLTPLVAGQLATLEVQASAAGTLDGWIDFGGDGSWAESPDRIAASLPLSAGVNALSVSVPVDVAAAEVLARFRFSSAGVASFAGDALDGEVEDYPVAIHAPSSVAARHVFYNNSQFDGNDPAATVADDAAIAGGKSALLPGGTAAASNYISFSKGINGLMIDVAGLPATALTAADFAFRTGNNNSPSTWPLLAIAPTVTLRAAAGVGGSDRVTLTWPDGTILKRWLQVTVLANARTGLAAADVFYFGNAVGEANNSTSDAVVNAADEIAARTHPVGPFPTAAVSNLYDFNRDRLVNATDQIIARTNSTNPLTALRLVSVPAESAGGVGTASLAAQVSMVSGEPTLFASRRRRRS